LRKKRIVFLGVMITILLSLNANENIDLNNNLRGPFTRSVSWTEAVNISNSMADSWGPKVVGDKEGNAYVIWIEEGRGKKDVYFNTNEKSGWEKPINATSDILILEGPWPSITIDKTKTVHMSYSARGPSTYDIFYNSYKNGKLNNNNKNISTTHVGGSARANIAVDYNSSFIYLVWMDDENAPQGATAYWEIMLCYKDPDKTSWSYINIIPTPSGRSYQPDITVDRKGTAHVVWIDRRYYNNSIVWYSSNPEPTDETKWTNPVIISDSTGVDFSLPQIDSDNNGNVYAVWENVSQGNQEIFFRQKIDGEWKEITNFSDTSTPSEQPTIAVDKETGDIYVAWAENIGNWEVFLKSYEDGEWSEAINLSNTSSVSGNPSLWVDEQGGIHLVYLDSFKGPYEVMYKYRTGKRRLLPPVNLSLETKINKILFYDEKINILKWEKNPENEQNQNITITKYSVYRKEVGENDEAYKEIYATPDINVFEYQDRNLPFNKKYAYAITAWDQNGNESKKSESVSEK